jgi:hypothetical protein
MWNRTKRNRRRFGKNVTKIDLAKISPTARAMMVARGAPERSLRGVVDLANKRMVVPSMHASRQQPITATVQMRQYSKSFEDPSGSWLMVVGSRDDEDSTIVAALGLMLRATIKSVTAPTKYHRPFFWRVFGGNYDKIRQNEEYRTSISKVGMLLLSNIAANSSPEKIEKARDLLAIYSDIPRVVTVVGCDPLVFALDHLYMRPDRVLHLGRRSEDRQI